MLFAPSPEKLLLIVEHDMERLLFRSLDRYFRQAPEPGWKRFVPACEDVDPEHQSDWNSFIQPDLEEQWQRVAGLAAELDQTLASGDSAIEIPLSRIQDLFCALSYFRHFIDGSEDFERQQSALLLVLEGESGSSNEAFDLIHLARRFQTKLLDWY